jgi:hypothetical protein
MPTCTFNDPASDGIAFGQTDLVPHVLAVSFEISDDLFEATSLGAGKILLSQHLLEPTNNPTGPAVEQHSQSFGHELSGLWTALIMEAKGGFSQVLQNVKDVQDEEGLGKKRTNAQKTLSVEDTDQLVALGNR